MSLQPCADITEAVALESGLGLYLKPVSKIKIYVQLPKMKVPGQSVSSWNVMEKLKATIRPDQFITLKSLKITATVIKFEGELETKTTCERALARLRAANNLKPRELQLKAAHSPCCGPTRHEWEAFYRDAKGMNEMKPGERPDTIHLQDLPVRWFASSSKPSKPSEKVLRKAFGTFGKIRVLEIPCNDSAANQNTFGKKSSLHNDLLFEAYVQYEEYVEFSIAMDSLRGKKLLYKDPDGKVYAADIKVDFDRTNYLSERCIKKRAAESQTVNNASSTESAKQSSECDSQISKPLNPFKLPDNKGALQVLIKEKTIVEEKKSTVNEEKLLLKELLHRAEKTLQTKEKLASKSPVSLSFTQPKERKKKEFGKEEEKIKQEKLLRAKEEEKRTLLKSHHEKKKKEKLMEQERMLKEKLLRNLRLKELQKVSENREKLRKELAGRKALKSVLAMKKSHHSSCKEVNRS